MTLIIIKIIVKIKIVVQISFLNTIQMGYNNIGLFVIKNKKFKMYLLIRRDFMTSLND